MNFLFNFSRKYDIFFEELISHLEFKEKSAKRWFEQDLSPIRTPAKRFCEDEDKSKYAHSTPNASSPSILIKDGSKKEKNNNVSFSPLLFIRTFLPDPKEVEDNTSIADIVKRKRRNASPKTNGKNKSSNSSSSSVSSRRRGRANDIQPVNESFSSKSSSSVSPKRRRRSKKIQPGDGSFSSNFSPSSVSSKRRAGRPKKIQPKTKSLERCTVVLEDIFGRLEVLQNSIKNLVNEEESFDSGQVDEGFENALNLPKNPEIETLERKFEKIVENSMTFVGDSSLRSGRVRRISTEKDGKSSKKRKKSKDNLKSVNSPSAVDTQVAGPSAPPGNVPKVDSVGTENVLDEAIEEILSNFQGEVGEKRKENQTVKNVEERNPNQENPGKSVDATSATDDLENGKETAGEAFGAVCILGGPAPDRDDDDDERSTIIFGDNAPSEVPKTPERKIKPKKGNMKRAPSSSRKPFMKKIKTKKKVGKKPFRGFKFAKLLKEISGLIKRLHEIRNMIAFLKKEKDMSNNKQPELIEHYDVVIEEQDERFRKCMAEHRSVILEGFRKLCAFSKKSDDIYLHISKEALLTQIEVRQVLEKCREALSEPNEKKSDAPRPMEKVKPTRPSQPSAPVEEPLSKPSKSKARVLPKTTKVPPATNVFDSQEDSSSPNVVLPFQRDRPGDPTLPSFPVCNRHSEHQPNTVNPSPGQFVYCLVVNTPQGPVHCPVDNGLRNMQPNEGKQLNPIVPDSIRETENQPENNGNCQSSTMMVKIGHDDKGLKFYKIPNSKSPARDNRPEENPSPANPPSAPDPSPNEPDPSCRPLRPRRSDPNLKGNACLPHNEHSYAGPSDTSKSARTDVPDRYILKSRERVPSHSPEKIGSNETRPDPLRKSCPSNQQAGGDSLISLTNLLIEYSFRKRLEKPKNGTRTTPLTKTTRSSGNKNFAPRIPEGRGNFLHKSPSPTRPEVLPPSTRRSPRKKSEEKKTPVDDLSRVQREKSLEQNSNVRDRPSASGCTPLVSVKSEKSSPEDENVEIETEHDEDDDDEFDCDEEFDLDKVKQELRERHGVIHYICAENKCMELGTQICTGCESVLYCSRKCQAKHWEKRHYNHCQQLRQQAEDRKQRLTQD